MKKLWFCLVLFIFLLPVLASAATINAASCSYNDVSAAINNAQSGDTVRVPAGNCTWNNQLVITKGSYLIGAGIGNTNIISGVTGNYLINYDPASPALNEPFRLSGFSLNLNQKDYGVRLGNRATAGINKIRVDHNRIDGTHSAVSPRPELLKIEGTVWGVADNNVFIGGDIGVLGADVTAWMNLAYDFGSADNFYFEDNTFISHDVACQVFYGTGGGRYCARYNDITAAAGLWACFDFHGNMGPGNFMATMAVEVYENTIHGQTFSVVLVDARGGKSLSYNNAVTTTNPTFAQRYWEEWNDNLNPPATGPTGQPQHVFDSYTWGNTFNGNRIDAIVPQTVNYSGDEGLVPQANRDFWYQGASFDGTVGVGVGLFSARPSTCTVGVGYWATDQSKLYRCTATNIWTVYYTPYTYPHPFRTDCVNYPGLCDSSLPPPKVYWVSPTGTSTWTNCQSATPLSGTSACSLSTANSNAAAGDTIYLRGGTYSGITGSAINPSNTGTAGNIITFSSYNGEDVELIGSGTSSIAVNLDSQCQDGGYVHPCTVTRNYIKVHDLHFSNFNRHLWIRFGSHNEISYCSFIGMPSDTSNLDWSASYIYRNAYYNWVHHSTFGDYGKCEPYGTDYGVVFQVGLETLLDSDVSNGWLAKYNLVENNEMYHGGHHVVSFNGVNNVFRNNSFRNDPWCPLSNPIYSTRTFFQTGVPGDGQYNLVEGNRIGYGGPKNKIEIGGAGGTIAGAYNIWRRNIFMQVYTDAMWVTFYPGQDHVKYNKIYNNDYWHGGYGNYQRWPDGTVPSNYWSDSYSHAICIGENDEGSEVYGNAIKNNIFYDNLCLQGENLSIIRYYPSVVPAYQEIANNWNDNAADPKFVDISGTPDPTLIATQFDFHLQSDSPCIDQGGFLTTITSSSGSGTQFQVADAGYFMDGWGIIEGDMLQLQGQTARARIVSVDYTTNTITVDTPLSWTSGLGMSLAYEGAAPDIGAYESSGGTSCVAADINCDGLVNLVDLRLVANDFGKTTGFYSRADTDGNGVVDIFDAVFVASRLT